MVPFEIQNDQFLLEGKPFKLISGGMHYFRIHPAYWRDRLEKLKAMGCNTLETYLPWNLHEPAPGRFDFKGMLDVFAYIDLAASAGLKVILRPTPFICGEFEFGGLPWWLLKDREMRVRSRYRPFTEALERYYDRLIPGLAERQISQGGPVIMVQVENEYGYYGSDRKYMEFLRDALTDRGIDVPLCTSDGPYRDAMIHGTLPGILNTGNFGSRAEEHFGKMKKLRPGEPLVCMEFWNGWFDAWGDRHHTRDAAEAAEALEEILKEGHVNIYMFHGGTNFGFTSGANHYERLAPDVTSYDYDAPLSESGEITDKYRAFREVIGKYAEVPEISLSDVIRRKAFGTLKAEARFSLTGLIDRQVSVVEKDRCHTFEDLDQGFGYMLYRVNLPGEALTEKIQLLGCADRAVVFRNGRIIAVRELEGMEEEIPFVPDGKPAVLDVLVENQGRVNFGHRMNSQRKGMDPGLLVDGCAVGPVLHYPLPLDRCPELPAESVSAEWLPGDAGFHRFSFSYSLEESGFDDTFLDMDGWGKGAAFINGFNLGRFWQTGPQRTLYVPGPCLQPGRNEIVIFETEGVCRDSVALIDRPILDRG